MMTIPKMHKWKAARKYGESGSPTKRFNSTRKNIGQQGSTTGSTNEEDSPILPTTISYMQDIWERAIDNNNLGVRTDKKKTNILA